MHPRLAVQDICPGKTVLSFDTLRAFVLQCAATGPACGPRQGRGPGVRRPVHAGQRALHLLRLLPGLYRWGAILLRSSYSPQSRVARTFASIMHTFEVWESWYCSFTSKPVVNGDETRCCGFGA